MGQRCEFKDLDGSYLPTREKVLLETASIAGGATLVIVLVFCVIVSVFLANKEKDHRFVLVFCVIVSVFLANKEKDHRFVLLFFVIVSVFLANKEKYHRFVLNCYYCNF